ncbi:hypothetical protein A2U01_0033565, partial [Trifolium medium]|nr:hypothetical protein [Trifolium medium]
NAPLRLHGGKHGGYTLVEIAQFEVESSDSGTRRRQSTLAFVYLVRDGEESGIVAPKGEAIGIRGNKTWELVGLLEVVGYKESLMSQLMEPPKIPRIVGSKRFFRRTNLIIPGAEEGTVKLVELPKIPMEVGGKIFLRAEGIPRDKRMRYILRDYKG